MPKLETLVDDIYKVFTDENHEIQDELIEAFASNVKEVVKNAIEEAGVPREPTLRMSKIGTPNRKLWYEFNETQETKPLTGSTYIKFLYGHILEELLLFLAKEAGHTVEGEQDELEIEGVVGHRDCRIDGVTVDVKTASKFGFEKFRKGTLFQDDPFGYIPQISGYMQAEGDEEGAFLVINKESGELTILNVHAIDTINTEERVKEIKEVVELDSPPEEKCYQPKPDGKSGNLALHNNCTYCPFKELCFKDANGGKGLRKFQYSNRVAYLTHVVNEPSVPEIIDK